MSGWRQILSWQTAEEIGHEEFTQWLGGLIGVTPRWKVIANELEAKGLPHTIEVARELVLEWLRRDNLTVNLNGNLFNALINAWILS